MVDLLAKLAKAEARAVAVEAELAKMTASFGDSSKKLQERVRLAEAQVVEVRTQADMDRVLLADGIHDESAIDYIRYAYGRVPRAEGAEAPKFEAFYDAYKADKADFLASFRAKPAAPEKAAVPAVPAVPAAPKAIVDPAMGRGGRSAPEPQKGAPSVLDAAQLAAMKPADALAALRQLGWAREAPAKPPGL